LGISGTAIPKTLTGTLIATNYTMTTNSHPTLSNLSRWAKERLKNAGIEDYEISADHLLRSLLGLSKADFILSYNQIVTLETEAQYRSLIERRAMHEPLQHLIGSVEFYSITLKSDRRALIPRPESEILVETVLAKLKGISSPRVLDIGTGSGNIAIALAKNIPDSHVVALDISHEALQLAEQNIELNGVANRVRLIQGDILDPEFIRALGKFNCVVSNPPYVADSEKGSLQPEVTVFEPAMAIFAGDDPLIFFKTIIGVISYILQRGGLLAFECGMGQAGEIAGMMRACFGLIEITPDLANIERVVTGVYERSD